MLGKRLLTAAVGILATLYIVNTGGILYYGAVNLLTLVALLEMTAMFKRSSFAPSLLISAPIVLLLLAVANFGNMDEMAFLITFLLVCVLLKLLFSHNTFSVPDAASTILCTLYTGWLFGFLILLRNISAETVGVSFGSLSWGAAVTWLMLLATWAGDTGAYFIGSVFGKHKLCPQISPGKTVEGALGGFVATLLTTVMLSLAIQVPLLHGILLGSIIGILAPAGDLIESVFKRYSGVKDTGKIFPGHGGVLDRFDSILLVAPAVYYYVRVFLID